MDNSLNSPNLNFRKRYNDLKGVSQFALKTTERYTKFRGVHNDKENVEMHTRFVIAIRNKWFLLRSDMIAALGMNQLEISPTVDPCIRNEDIIDVLWQHWRMSKNCIEAIKSGLKANNL